jgi:hypothetical protein
MNDTMPTSKAEQIATETKRIEETLAELWAELASHPKKGGLWRTDREREIEYLGRTLQRRRAL